jgi:hypothetical protein
MESRREQNSFFKVERKREEEKEERERERQTERQRGREAISTQSSTTN